MKKILFLCFTLAAVACAGFSQSPAAFVHPGVMSSQAELDYIKACVSANDGSPVVAGYNVLASNSKASLSYTATPYATVNVIASGSGPEEDAYRGDAHAAYAQAIRWVVTGNPAYKDKAIQILNGWASTFQTLVCTTSAQQTTLESSWALPLWIASAEIIKNYNHGAAGWAADDVAQFNTFVRNTLVYVNGKIASAPNWYISKYLSLMSAGVFLDDATLYNAGYNGAMAQINSITAIGEIPELTRDFEHSQYNLIGQAMCAEIAHQQGNDALFLSAAAGAKPHLLIGAEAYVTCLTGTGTPNYNSSSVSQRRSAPYEILLLRYTQLGMDVPQTRNYVLTLNRPEDLSQNHFLGWLSATHSSLPITIAGIPGIHSSRFSSMSDEQPIIFNNNNLSLRDGSTTSFQVVNTIGQLVKTKIAPVMNVGELAEGIYLVRANHSIQKIVKR